MRHLLFPVIRGRHRPALPVPGQAPSGAIYAIDIDPDNVFRVSREDDSGQKALFVTVQFQIHKLNTDGGRAALTIEVPEEMIVVKENGVIVSKRKIMQPKTQLLTTVLALDIAGSMKDNNKMQQAKTASLLFLDSLDSNANTGLILFDHEFRRKKSSRRSRKPIMPPTASNCTVRPRGRTVRRHLVISTPRPKRCSCSRIPRAAGPSC